MAQAADVVVDLAAWLLDTMGTGPAGHLWPAGAAAASLDPIAVQAGASGVGLFLAQLLRGGRRPARARPAAARRGPPPGRPGPDRDLGGRPTGRNPQRPPGPYFGTSGVAWFLAEAAGALGRDDLLRRANELALAIPVRVPNSDITHGTAGIGLGQLQQWLVTGDDRFLARAVVAAEQVLRAAVREPDAVPGVTWPGPTGAPTRLAGTVSYGYAHGNAGIATFLFAAAAATGEGEFAAVATEALLTVLPQAVTIDGAAYWPASPETASDASEAGYWPSWCNGSSGMGTAFLRAHLATGEPAFRVAAEAAARAGLRERWRSSAVQCHGLAGDAELLIDLAAPTGRPALTAAEAIFLQRRTATTVSERAVFADDSGATVSAGFGTGLAGTGAFLLRLVTGGPRPLMLDQLLATPQGSRGDRPPLRRSRPAGRRPGPSARPARLRLLGRGRPGRLDRRGGRGVGRRRHPGPCRPGALPRAPARPHPAGDRRLRPHGPVPAHRRRPRGRGPRPRPRRGHRRPPAPWPTWPRRRPACSPGCPAPTPSSSPWSASTTPRPCGGSAGGTVR